MKITVDTKTMAAAVVAVMLLAASFVVMMAAGPAGARLDERLNDNVPYAISPAPAADNTGSAATYEVRNGDTLASIANIKGVSLETLISANGITNPDRIFIGQRLKMPADTVVHLIQTGETLLGIAARYKVDVYALAAQNDLRNDDKIFAGRQLRIPGAAAPETIAVTGVPLRLVWPLFGTITSNFGIRDGRPHEGIDIAAEENTPINVVAPGEVVFAGPRGTYGLAVIIDHGNGMSTLYAHCARLLVEEGDWADSDTIIALSGNTGRSTGPHLHLEILQNGVPLDPLIMLSRGSYYG